MLQSFTKEIKGREYEFSRTFFGNELQYVITIKDDTGKLTPFRMRRDEENLWKTQAQVLPKWVHEAEDDLGMIIYDNENNIE